MAKTHRRGSGVLPIPPLLITESKEEFDRIRDALYQEIKPRGIIEQMYVEEMADLANIAVQTLQSRCHQFGVSRRLGKTSWASHGTRHCARLDL